MAGPERFDAFELMKQFRFDERRLGDALGSFVEREDYGFVWLAYREDVLVGCCSVGYVIDTTAGGVAAVIRDLYVRPDVRRTGVATALLESLSARLSATDVAGYEMPSGAPDVTAFLTARGFIASPEQLFKRNR